MNVGAQSHTLAGAQKPVALGNAPGEVEHERDRELGRGLGEHVRRVRDENATPRRGVDVDVVVADGVVGDHPEAVARGVEQLVVDLVGQHRQETRAARCARQELRRFGGRSESWTRRSKRRSSSECTGLGTRRERKTSLPENPPRRAGDGR